MFKTESTVRTYVTDFIYLVYGWMVCALGITTGVAYFVAQSDFLYSYIFASPLSFWALMLGQLGLVVVLSSMIDSLSYTAAVVLFLLYAASLGISLSAIFLLYQIGSIVSVFGITAGMFGAMALYGYTTKRDLTAWSSYFMMALFGIVIASMINIFLMNSVVSFVISIFGVLLFTGLTAYDMQQIKRLALVYNADEQMRSKGALLGALTLYLDFVNLFLYLLRLLGKKK